MQCPSCRLRYNSVNRIPRIIGCGHSLCSSCIPKNQQCIFCLTKINPQSKPNYSLMELIEKEKNNLDKFIKICLIGSSGVGKTSLIRMLTNNQYKQDTPSTVGYDFTFQDRQIKGFIVRFQFWDSAGQQRYRAISPIHYKNANIVVLVYDVNSNQEKNNIEYWINETQKHCPKQVKIILVGNKLDLLEGMAKPLQKKIWQKINEKEIQLNDVCCKNGQGNQKMWSIFQQYFKNRNKIIISNENIIERQKNKQLKNGIKNIELKKTKLEKLKEIKQKCC